MNKSSVSGSWPLRYESDKYDECHLYGLTPEQIKKLLEDVRPKFNTKNLKNLTIISGTKGNDN